MSPETRYRLEDMRAQAARAVEALGDRTDAALGDDDLRVTAILHFVQIVGEAASRVDPTDRESLSDIPWKNATSIRNIIVHAYRTVRSDIVADTVRNDFPALITTIDRLLAETHE